MWGGLSRAPRSGLPGACRGHFWVGNGGAHRQALQKLAVWIAWIEASASYLCTVLRILGGPCPLSCPLAPGVSTPATVTLDLSRGADGGMAEDSHTLTGFFGGGGSPSLVGAAHACLQEASHVATRRADSRGRPPEGGREGEGVRSLLPGRAGLTLPGSAQLWESRDTRGGGAGPSPRPCVRLWHGLFGWPAGRAPQHARSFLPSTRI